MEYCPDCITRLVKDKKKLGRLSVWLVCPNCGLRKRPDRPETAQQALESVLKITETNNTVFGVNMKEVGNE